jgi:hypothetical protein
VEHSRSLPANKAGMKPRIAIPLGVAGILAAIGTTIANANGLFAGHPSLAYWFWAASLVLLVIAIAGWLLGRDKAPLSQSPPPTAPQIITQHQEFNPQFTPTINIGTPDSRAITIEQERARQEDIVLDYLRRQHERRPYSVHFLGSIAAAVGMTPSETDQTLKRLFAKDLVFRDRIEAAGDFIWRYRDLV